MAIDVLSSYMEESYNVTLRPLSTGSQNLRDEFSNDKEKGDTAKPITMTYLIIFISLLFHFIIAILKLCRRQNFISSTHCKICYVNCRL